MNFHDLEILIKEKQGDAVEFGNANCDLNPLSFRVVETEERIGAKLPPSYLWFVNNYGGGEIYGEEVFSIYKVYQEESVGDIAVKTCMFRDSGFIDLTEIAISSNNFGEIFVLDTMNQDEEGEYPVLIRRGLYKERYARHFAEFLIKRISDPES